MCFALKIWSKSPFCGWPLDIFGKVWAGSCFSPGSLGKMELPMDSTTPANSSSPLVSADGEAVGKCFIYGWPIGSKVIHVAVSSSSKEQGQPAGVLECPCYCLHAPQRVHWHKPCANAAMLSGEVGASAGHGSATLPQTPAFGRCVQVSLQAPMLTPSCSCHSFVT